MPQEKKQPWQPPTNPDAAVMKGGPEDEQRQNQPQPDAPKMVSVKYGGKEFQVPEDVAQSWTEREREFSAKLSEHSDELGKLRKTAQEYEAVKSRFVTPQQQQADPAVLMFENPAKFVQDLREGIKAEVRQEYLQYEGDNRAWMQFSQKHEDLADERDLVTWIAQRHAAELQTLPPSQRADHLADITRKEILRVHAKFKSNGADEELTNEVPFVESPGRRTPRPVPREEEPKSLSQILRERRSARLHPREPKGG